MWFRRPSALTPCVVSEIFVADIKDAFWIRVDGAASLQDAPRLKRCLEQAVEHGRPLLVVDLETCRSMDSSFMGTLCAAALNLAGNPDAATRLELINVGPRCLAALEELGIAQLLQIDRTGESLLEERSLVAACLDRDKGASGARAPDVGASKDDLARHSLDAHRALGAASADNLCRFRDVLDYLEKKTAQRDSAGIDGGTC